MDLSLVEATLRLSRDPRLGPAQRRILLSALPVHLRPHDLMGVEALPAHATENPVEPLPKRNF